MAELKDPLSDELVKLVELAKATQQQNTQTLDALSGLLGVVIGVLLEKQVITRQELVDSIERLSQKGSPLQQTMLAVAQSAVDPQRH